MKQVAIESTHDLNVLVDTYEANRTDSFIEELLDGEMVTMTETEAALVKERIGSSRLDKIDTGWESIYQLAW